MSLFVEREYIAFLSEKSAIMKSNAVVGGIPMLVHVGLFQDK
jgi:hypothetical protein